jgi:anhydro-N-acetylmuramic acid kinase
MQKIYTAIGLMSGTSMDGVDAAIIKTDGQKILEFGETHFKEYPGWLKLKLRKLISDVQNTKAGLIEAGRATVSPDFEFYLNEVERDITKFHAQIIDELIINAKLHSAEIDVVGFHGHTIDHRPEDKFTWQIGDGEFLAEKCKMNIICNFRQNDINLGGQGAPLLPLYHKAIVADEYYAACVVNIGGVSNITYIDEQNLIAFDTGPGNALIDDIIFENTGRHFDDEGKVAQAGKVNAELLNLMVNNLYFQKKPPKSLDRNQFSSQAKSLLSDKFKNESFANKVATLTEFTVQAIVKSIEHLPQKPKAWFVCGGGVHNKFIMSRLKEELAVPVKSIVKLNEKLNPDFIEAQGFAFLAVRSLLGLPLTYASTTGVKTDSKSATGGVLFKA